MKINNKLLIGLGLLVLLSPLGLILPDYFKAGTAWGEWGREEIQGFIGYLPEGFKKLSGLWDAPIHNYSFKGWEQKGLPQLSFAYIISAIIGIVVTVLIVLILGKVLTKKGN